MENNGEMCVSVCDATGFMWVSVRHDSSWIGQWKGLRFTVSGGRIPMS